MPHTMPKNPNWRKKKDELTRPALQIDVRRFDAEAAKRDALRAKKTELRSRQAARNHLIRDIVEQIESAGRRLPRRKMLLELALALPHIPAHVLSAVTAPAAPAGRA